MIMSHALSSKKSGMNGGRPTGGNRVMGGIVSKEPMENERQGATLSERGA
jgi:hypothetical protein